MAATSVGVFGAAAVVVLMVLGSVELSAAAVYKVGDSQGWTIMGNPNYTAWALSKKFEVGDVILFEYNKQFHNVMHVSKEDYRACNVNSPMKTYTSGNDSIEITNLGHHYFLCGVPGHCVLGQKVDIRIPKIAAAPSAAPSSSPAAAASGGATAPAPSSALTTSIGRLGIGLCLIAPIAASMLIMA